MRITILTNEYPPHIYGGAGVHVEYLTRELCRADNAAHIVDLLCFGDQASSAGNLTVQGIRAPCTFQAQDPRHQKFLDALGRNLAMTGRAGQTDIVHCHTWYSHLGGCLVKQLTGARLVLTTHSLEPHRPWKVEQLGSAYHGSTWVERTAYHNADGVVAVSASMRDDVHALYGVAPERIRVIPNGIDLDQYRPTPDQGVLERYQIDASRRYILFVGRITRQKGIIHLVSALKYLQADVQVVLCAGAPDTEEIGKEMTAKVDEVRHASKNPIIWIQQMVPREDVIPLYSQAALFVCPSVYEPFGIINLEAMACGTPVVASAVGGIREVVVHGETGLLVPFAPRGSTNFEPKDGERFAHDLAAAIDELLASPERMRLMGQKSRAHVEQHFSWASVARRTLDFYRDLQSQPPANKEQLVG